MTSERTGSCRQSCGMPARQPARQRVRATLPRGLFAAGVLLLVLGTGCARMTATRREPVGVPVESRPTPPQPPENAPAPDSLVPPTPPPDTTTHARAVVQSRLAADTTAAVAAARRCEGRRLFPEQESTYDSVLELLNQTRAALARGDMTRAESFARQARQLATSLNCR